MRSERERSALLDNPAQHFARTGLYPRPGFRDDLTRLYAVTGCLEIISEASRRVSEAVKRRHPEIRSREMAGAGSVYRHDYEDVAAHRVSDTVQKALPPLRSAVEQELDDS
jgi:uncharacterized protein with HEPN domain